MKYSPMGIDLKSVEVPQNARDIVVDMLYKAIIEDRQEEDKKQSGQREKKSK
jgi:hypothetical protein